MSGPLNFMGRLEAALARRRLPPHRIRMPASPDRTERRPDEVLIGRFDGLFMYRFTPAAAYNFLRATKAPFLPRLAVLERLPLGSLAWADRAIARHLNRRDGALKAAADAIVYQSRLSEAEHHAIAGSDPPRKPVAIIPNGVPLDVFRPLAPTGRLEGAPRLAITAQFRLGKRLAQAIAVVNRLRRRHPAAVLHVIGDQDRLVRESLRDLDLSACRFHGRVPSEALPLLYADLDLGLSPALFDPCPNAVIEMLASGLPVLTTAASGAAELVPDAELIVPEARPLTFTELHTAARIPPIDTEAWSAAIERVLAERAGWREASLEHARRTFDIERIADRYATVIEEAWAARTE